jgi:hypothetical protein
MTPAEVFALAADTIPLWRAPAVVVLFGLAAVGFLLWWDVMFGDDE